MSILNRIRCSTQRGKRKEMLDRYGFYVTFDTHEYLGTHGDLGALKDYYKESTHHIHGNLDCPFLIKPHHKNAIAYSCGLLLNSPVYSISKKDLLHTNPFYNGKYPIVYHCVCIPHD